jgi:RalA-binding protein 1
MNLSSRTAGTPPPESLDVDKLIKAAGSAEAVIQYLLKEKNSQSQQNSQLWRLVDKQRAMILGLNKDLERALKEKEKYRKKLKEVMAAQHEFLSQGGGRGTGSATPDSNDTTILPQLIIPPDSPSVGSDSQKQSPMQDMSMAPYPITPPADQPKVLTPVAEMLDPSEVILVGLQQTALNDALQARVRPDYYLIDLVNLPNRDLLRCRYEGVCW